MSILSHSFADEACVSIQCTSEIAESLISSVEIWIDDEYLGSREVYCNVHNHIDKIGEKERICKDVPRDQLTSFGIKVVSESVDLFHDEETSGGVSLYAAEELTFYYDPKKDPEDPKGGVSTGQIIAIGVGGSRQGDGFRSNFGKVVGDPAFWDEIFGTDDPVDVDRMSEIFDGTLFKAGYGDKMSFVVSVEPSIVLTVPSSPIPGTNTRERWVTNHSSQRWRVYSRPTTIFIDGIKGGASPSGFVDLTDQGYIVWDVNPGQILVIRYRVDYVPLNDVPKLLALQDHTGEIKSFWWDPLGVSEAKIRASGITNILQFNHPADGDIQILDDSF